MEVVAQYLELQYCIGKTLDGKTFDILSSSKGNS